MVMCLQDCAARGLHVDVGHELPVEQRTRTDSSGRELNLVRARQGRYACTAGSSLLQHQGTSTDRSQGRLRPGGGDPSAPAPFVVCCGEVMLVLMTGCSGRIL
jgi:hypothetical protein